MDYSTSYRLLLSFIESQPVSSNQLNELKLHFKNIIGSERRISCICSAKDLFQVLEKQQIISENDVSALKFVGVTLNNSEISKVVANYVPIQDIHEFNYYALLKQNENNSNSFDKLSINNNDSFQSYSDENEDDDVYPTRPPNPYNFLNSTVLSDEKREIIYNYICSNIGRKWRAFGRALQIREGEMDDLDSEIRNSKERNRRLLRMVEEEKRVDPKQLPLFICNALVKSGHDHMREEVQNILSRH